MSHHGWLGLGFDDCGGASPLRGFASFHLETLLGTILGDHAAGSLCGSYDSGLPGQSLAGLLPRGSSMGKSCTKTHGILNHLETIVYHLSRQLWPVLGVKLMEINSNLFSRHLFFSGVYFFSYGIIKCVCTWMNRLNSCRFYGKLLLDAQKPIGCIFTKTSSSCRYTIPMDPMGMDFFNFFECTAEFLNKLLLGSGVLIQRWRWFILVRLHPCRIWHPPHGYVFHRVYVWYICLHEIHILPEK